MPARTTASKAAQSDVDAAAAVPDDATPITLPDGRVMSADDFQALLDQLASPFRPDQVEKLPKQLRKDDRDKFQCRQGTQASADGHYCGGYHARSLHLDYVGHAGVTDRLNAVDPFWNWEPVALTPAGTPAFSDGGMWIRLTVLGITRLGFGDAGGKSGPNAVKEVIGDAIRNAAMRFGVATYLWSKSEAAKSIAAGGDPDDTTPEAERPDHVPLAVYTDVRPAPQTPAAHSQRVWAAFNALDDQVKVQVQRSWPSGLVGPDYITTREGADRAVEHITKVHEQAEREQATQQGDGPPFP